MIKRATFDDNGKKVPVKLTVREQMRHAAAMADDCRSKLQWHLTPTAREMYEDSLLRHTQDWIRLKKQADLKLTLTSQ